MLNLYGKGLTRCEVLTLKEKAKTAGWSKGEGVGVPWMLLLQ